MTHAWLKTLTDSSAMGRLIDAMSPKVRVVAEGSWGSSATLTAGAIAARTGRPVLLVVAHLDDADEAAEDLRLFDGLTVTSLPALEVMPGESNVSLELLADRLGLAAQLMRDDQPHVVIAPIQALMHSIPTGDALAAMTLQIDTGEALSQETLTHWLQSAGYNRADALDEPGDFAVRGGIVDVFGPGGQPPVRIDFFGDDVDTIAEVDLDSMGSNRRLKSVRLIGASTEQIQSNEQTTHLTALLNESTVVVTHEMLEVAEQGRGYYERLTDPRGIYAPHTVTKHLLEFAYVEVNQYTGPDAGDVRVTLPVQNLINFNDTAVEAVKELGELTLDADPGPAPRVIVLCDNQAERDRLLELILQHAPEASDDIELQVAHMHRGFGWGGGADDSGDRPMIFVPHHELFHRYQTRRRLRRVTSGRAIDTFIDVEIGDFVVHRHHGIARFKGLRVLKRDDGTPGEEYLTLEFASKALLHVPASQIELVQKYIGGFSGRPPLSKLGGTRWRKTTEQTKEAVRDLAAELLRVQAARAALPGIRYPEDSPWMKQFEAEFPYVETDDQTAAMVEIKKDMTHPQPTDRLICGDVGYGKTELAIRAAFKAVESGKQVAVLCPTTLLCEQHERTFRQRMADYPMRIESLSRFKTLKEAKEIIEQMRLGSVDIAIGTHRLLSEDVQFADLGLVVIDEEQRFGVEHKSKLMRFRVTVEVITMSATPIPRTLHMALLGLRDISSLSTPPADRRSIVTEVMPFERERVRQSILRELNRGGQSYFVHNRVHNIHAIANDLRSLVPEATFIVGHGQMPGRELEGVMRQFIAGNADVLISTTIIENGIDIPTANTMFIHEADRFGLAELHQLRGRVGRYKNRAYCYLLLPETRTLTDIAARRLRAIEEFSMLGAGFKIAMRDMEIRGVGNILGPEQSGHIAAVGYEMYCQLLEEAVAELKKQDIRRPVDTHVELQVSGHFPRSYIPSDRHRMDAYRRLSRAHDFETLRAVEQDLAEAYGEMPKPAELLVALAEIRVGLSLLSVEALKRDGPDLIFTTSNIPPLFETLSEAQGSVRLVDQPKGDKPGTVFYRPPENYLEPTTLPAILRKLLAGVSRDTAPDSEAQTVAAV